MALDGKMPPATQLTMPSAAELQAKLRAKINNQLTAQTTQSGDATTAARRAAGQPAAPTNPTGTSGTGDKKVTGKPVFGLTTGTPTAKPTSTTTPRPVGNVFGTGTPNPSQGPATQRNEDLTTPSPTDKGAKEHTDAVAKAAGKELVDAAGGVAGVMTAAAGAGVTIGDLGGNESVNGQPVDVSSQSGAPQSVDRTVAAMKEAARKKETKETAKAESEIDTSSTDNEAE